jgi:hypothetical protein
LRSQSKSSGVRFGFVALLLSNPALRRGRRTSPYIDLGCFSPAGAPGFTRLEPGVTMPPTHVSSVFAFAHRRAADDARCLRGGALRLQPARLLRDFLLHVSALPCKSRATGAPQGSD